VIEECVILYHPTKEWGKIKRIEVTDGPGLNIFTLPRETNEDIESEASSRDELREREAENSISDVTFDDATSSAAETELSAGEYVLVLSKEADTAVTIAFGVLLEGPLE